MDIKVIGPDPARVFNFVSIEVDQAERDKLNNIKLTDVSGPDISYLTKAINAEIIKAVWNKELVCNTISFREKRLILDKLPEKEISCLLVPIPFKFLESFSNSFLSSLRTQIANLEERLARVERERDEAIAEAELRTHERDEAIAQVASREDQLRRAAEVLGRQ